MLKYYGQKNNATDGAVLLFLYTFYYVTANQPYFIAVDNNTAKSGFEMTRDISRDLTRNMTRDMFTCQDKTVNFPDSSLHSF